MNVFQLFATLGINTQDYDSGLSRAQSAARSKGASIESAFEKMGKGAASALAGVAKFAAKATIAMTAAAAAGIVAITKSAVSAYANYEQLVGGVEKLFGETAQKAVMNYAKNAYRAAGLSANEYMETVTGFSASLIASLSGNTQLAAEYANMAVQDMADNANTFGTSMASIQAAYAGFAKQNYTMLDNLKLGYGGTKEEMQRLLKDAEAISGVHYDINSFADIVAAIHVMQVEMGIAGTTAKEAGNTIQGSMSAVKASWQNLMTAIAGGGDIDEAMDALIDSLFGNGAANKGLLPQLTQRIGVIMQGIGKALVKGVPVLAKQFPEFVRNLLPSVITAVVQLVKQIGNALPEILDVLFQAMDTLLPQLLVAMKDAIPTLVKGLADIVINLADFLANNTDVIIEAFFSIFDNVAANLPRVIESLTKNLPQIVGELAVAIPQAIKKIDDIGPSIIKAMFEGMDLSSVFSSGEFGNLFSGIGALIEGNINRKVSTFELKADAVLTVADLIIPGVREFGLGLLGDVKNFFTTTLPGWASDAWNGITGLVSKVWDGATQIVATAWDGVKTFFTTTLPGWASDAWQAVTGAVSGVWNGATQVFSNAWSGVKTFFTETLPGWADAAVSGIQSVFIDVANWLADNIINPIIDVINLIPGVSIKHIKIAVEQGSVEENALINEDGSLKQDSEIAVTIKAYYDATGNLPEGFHYDDGKITVDDAHLNVVLSYDDGDMPEYLRGTKGKVQKDSAGMPTYYQDLDVEHQTLKTDVLTQFEGWQAQDLPPGIHLENGKPVCDDIQAYIRFSYGIGDNQGVNLPWRPHAAGLSYVPYDNYAARLHKGERVLDAKEAARYNAILAGAGASANTSLSIQNYNVYDQSDAQGLVSLLIREQQRTMRGRGVRG